MPNSALQRKVTITAAIFVTLCLVLAFCDKVQNTLIVTNNSGITAEQIVVTVCREKHTFTGLQDGDSKTQNFSVKHDSGFLVTATLADGAKLTNGFGYVTGGAGAYGNRALIEITNDKRIIGKQQ